MKTLVSICATVLRISLPVHALDFHGANHTRGTLLLSKNSQWIREVARGIYSEPETSVEVTDVVAELLIRSCSGREALLRDTQAWLAKALGSTKNQRYKPVVQTCLDSNIEGNFNSHAEVALEAMTETGDAYYPGSVALDSLGERLAKISREHPRQPDTAQFETLNVGIYLQEMHDRVGYPSRIFMADDVAANHKDSRKFYSPWLLKRFQEVNDQRANEALRIVAEYEGFSRLQFVRTQTGKWLAEAVVQWTGSPTGANADNRLRILLPNSRTFRDTVQEMFRNSNFDKETLDLAATRLENELDAEEAFLVDALAWTCKLLGASKNPGYREVLVNVSENASKYKLRRYAKAALVTLDE